MNTLPLDTSHPAVRDYLALVRLQVLTPLSLLLNIATVVVCASITTPNIAYIAHIHRTAISPKFALIAIYVIAIYVGQFGYCLLLVLASKPETKVFHPSPKYHTTLTLESTAYANKSRRSLPRLFQLCNGTLGYRMGPPMVPYHDNSPRDSFAPPYLFKYRLTRLPPTYIRPSIRHGTNPRPTPFLPRPPSICSIPLLSLVRPSFLPLPIQY
jgi:hypothetical protein